MLVSLVFLFAFSGSPQARPDFFVVPNFRDLKVQVNHQHGLGPELVSTWYFKGARERQETAPTRALPPFSATLFECDLKTQVHLNERAKTYFSLPLGRELPPREDRPLPKARSDPTATMTVTVDTVDTGERRQQGSYEARHVKTTITMTPAKGSTVPARKTEIDGWYIDIPGMSCRNIDLEREPVGIGLGFAAPPSAGQFPRLEIKHTGTGRRGFAIEETSRETGEGNVLVNKTKLVEFSEEPLDPSLFEVPSDYTEAERPVFNRQSPGQR